MIFNCVVCKCEKKIPDCYVTRYKNKVCSKKCRFELMKTDKSINPNYKGGECKKCLNCNKDFYVKPSHTERRKCCSKECISEYKIKTGALKGSNNPQWIDGRTKLTRDERHSLEYRNWRKEVIEKCGKVCCLCESTENLHVDHIKSFKDYPELRYDVENGRVLCFTCHKQTDNYGKKKQTVS